MYKVNFERGDALPLCFPYWEKYFGYVSDLSLFKRISQINCLILFFMIKREKTLASQDQKKFKNNPIIIHFSKNKYMRKSNKTEHTDSK